MRRHAYGRIALMVLVAVPVASQGVSDRFLLDNLVQICPTDSSLSTDRLLRRQRELAPPGSAVSPERWAELACTRAWLAGHGALSRDSWRMPLGTSWRHGAAEVALLILDRNPADPVAAPLYAALNEDRVLARPDREVGARLAAAIDAGMTSSMVWRGCAEVGSRLGEYRRVDRCARDALAHGADSTFHLIHLARLAARNADTIGASELLYSAVAAAVDSASKAAADWQVRWFLWPEEEAAWDTLAPGARASWFRRIMALRDVRDGRPAGARVVEHFNRLESVLGQFRMNVMPINRKRIMELPAEPDGPGGGCDPANWGARGTYSEHTMQSYGASCVLREFRRWQSEIDDRGAVWMRFGEPVRRVFFAEPWPAENFIWREAWSYQVDGQPIVVSFESEQWDGTNEATRIVPTALRDFICALDNWRCYLNARGSSSEQLMSLREQDFQIIDAVTSMDNNAPPVSRHIRMGARYLRLWDPATGRLIGIAPWSIRLGDLEVRDGLARFDLVAGMWDAQHEVGFDTVMPRNYRIPPGRDGDTQLTGVLDLPASPGITGWSLFARQEPDAGGRSFDIEAAPLSTGALAISDLVLGAEGQGVKWTGASEPVILAPLGVIDRKEEVLHLYFQVSSRAFHEDASIAIRVYRSDRRGDTPAIAVTMPARLGEGINEIRREIGLSELDSGTYRLEVEVRAGGMVVERSTTLVLR